MNIIWNLYIKEMVSHDYMFWKIRENTNTILIMKIGLRERNLEECI